MTDPLSSTWRPGRPVDLAGTLGVLVRGRGDPSHRMSPDGGMWRVSRTPLGPASLYLLSGADGVSATAWGPGAGWAIDQLPTLLGAADDIDGFMPHHAVVAQAWHRHPGWRVPRTERVLEALVPAILEQKVTGHEAFGGWRRLLQRWGEPAPGPAGQAGLRVPPDASTWAAIPSWQWLQAGVDGARSATVVRAARRAGRIEQTLGRPGAQVDAGLTSIPGVGRWTSAETRQRAHGDADAVSFGDFHVPTQIGRALTGRPVDDDGLAELLEPYRPHRYRVQRLLELVIRQPRRAPRPPPRRHLPTS